MMADQRKHPRYIYLPPAAAEQQAELTRTGTYNLLPSEKRWRDRKDFLQGKGYRLRQRYSRNWKPSWTGTNLDPEFCEDSVMLNVRPHSDQSEVQNPDVIDAYRQQDNLLVAIKIVKRRSKEIEVSQYLSSIKHPANHCVPVLDVLDDPLDPTTALMVMEYLRPFYDPEFAMIGDVVDFVTQMLDGLAFLHEHHVAHRDIAPPNIMMDARPLYPNGHHPIRRRRSPDLLDDAIPLARMDHPVKYFFVDFGLSVHFRPGDSPLVVGDVGRDDEVPELSSTVPYDAFKADIYALGNLFDKEFAQKYHSLEFLREIVDAMKQRQPDLRPTAGELVQLFQKTRKEMNPTGSRWRLGPKSEPAYERLFNDTVAVAKDGFTQFRRFVRPA